MLQEIPSLLLLAWPAVAPPQNADRAPADSPSPTKTLAPRSDAPRHLDCAFQAPSYYLEEIRMGVEQGLIADPSTRPIPPIAPASPNNCSNPVHHLSSRQIFLYEDTQKVLQNNFSVCELYDLMADASNSVMAAHGDNFDFIGFWLNYDPDYQIGAAFYMPIENDVSGIGDASTVGTPIFNHRPCLGVGGSGIEGWIMMWNINTSYWQPGTSSSAAFTRLALAQEFEHRFALFLPDLLDGRQMQGDNGNCGRGYHWSWAIDGQGSGMEIGEWTGANPATAVATGISFNTDTGGVFSWPDLYLMGYASAGEMDASISELRYMDNSTCDPTHAGTVSTFSSMEIIASAGPRLPDWTSAQKDFRCAWVMIHLPGQPPTREELEKTTEILRQHQKDWFFGTLQRGTMNNTLFDECLNTNRWGGPVPDAGSRSAPSGS